MRRVLAFREQVNEVPMEMLPESQSLPQLHLGGSRPRHGWYFPDFLKALVSTVSAYKFHGFQKDCERDI